MYSYLENALRTILSVPTTVPTRVLILSYSEQQQFGYSHTEGQPTSDETPGYRVAGVVRSGYPTPLGDTAELGLRVMPK